MFNAFLSRTLCVIFFYSNRYEDESSAAKINRYTSCIEAQSEIGRLTYDEMKEVCGKYLE